MATDYDPTDEFLASIESGEFVLWADRVQPLEVVDTSFGSHIMVRGPRGAIYRIEPAEDEYRLGHRYKHIRGLEVVDE